jgi:hypothetical protein
VQLKRLLAQMQWHELLDREDLAFVEGRITSGSICGITHSLHKNRRIEAMPRCATWAPPSGLLLERLPWFPSGVYGVDAPM